MRFTKEQKEAHHEALGRALCSILGKNPEDWKSLEAVPIPMTNSQEIPICPLSSPSNKIHFMELRITK